MAREKNLKIYSEKLDKVIRAAEGDKYDAKRISKFVLGKCDSYYSKSVIQNHNISKDAYERLCEYYNLKPEDYILTEAKEKEVIQEKADTQNYENIIILLTGIDKTLKELLATQKSTNYILGEIKNGQVTNNQNSKKVIELVDNIDKNRRPPARKYS